MDNNYCVYVHIVPNDKRYYGITSQKPKKRWGKEGRGYKSRNIKFYNDILFYGWDNIQHIVIAKGLTKDEAEWLEEGLIRTNKTYDSNYGYNKHIGNAKGYKYSEEAKVKISEAKSGVNNPFYGKYGANSPNHKSVICTTTNVVFDTVREGADYYGIYKSDISKCCKGKKRSAGKSFDGTKLVWRYLTIIEI